MKIFRIFFLCIGMMFIFQAASGQSSSQFRAALRQRADLINDLKTLQSQALSQASPIANGSEKDNLASFASDIKKQSDVKKDITSATSNVNETGKQDIQPLNFAGMKWGVGLGVSSLNHSEVVRATLVGSSSRILEERKRNSGIVFEYHLLTPLTKSFRKRDKEMWAMADSLSDKFARLAAEENIDDNALKSLMPEIQMLDDMIATRSYGVNPVESGLANLNAKIAAFKVTKAFANSTNKDFKNKLELLETSIKYAYEILSFSKVVVGCGPFAAIKTGGADTFGINSMALGIMFGLKAVSLPEKCFNIGFGWSLNNGVKRLANNVNYNNETDLDKMFTVKDEQGWMVVISTDIW